MYRRIRRPQTFYQLFKTGGQVGLTPNEILDMSLDTLNAYIEGYGDRLFDQELISVHTGYWVGYYLGSKKPKPLHTILERLVQRKQKVSNPQQHVDTVDVEAFKSLERRLGDITNGR